MILGRSTLLVLVAVAVSAAAGPAALVPRTASAQPYARFAVPNSMLVPALRAAGAEFEGAWNALLVAELRASLARADSARALAALEGRVAGAEPQALGTRIATDALALRHHWTPRQCERRIAAAETEAAATAAQRARRWTESDSLFRVTLAAYRALGERRREAWALGSAGSTWFLAGDYGRADSLYRLALAARRAVGDSVLVGRALNTLGTIAMLTGRNAEARDLYLQTRTLRTAIGDRAGLAATLNYLAAVAVRLGERDSARVWYEQALDLAVARGDSANVAEVLSNYARLLGDAGEAARGQALCERAIRIARSRNDARIEASLQFTRADLLRLQGRFTEAARGFSTSAALNEVAGNPRELMLALNSLGRVWNNLQDPVRALPPLERAVALADSLGDSRNGGYVLNDLAIALRLAGDEREAARRALRACDQAVAAGDSALVHDVCVTLGLIAARERRDLPAARAWLGRASRANPGLPVERRTSDLIDQGHVATEEGRAEEAEDFYRQALDLAERSGLPDPLWLAMIGMGDVAERRGRFTEALAWDRRAATLIDTLRARQREERGSVALFSGRLYPYEALIHLLGKLDARFPDSAYAAEAFLWAERARARAFLDLVQASGASAAAVTPLGLGQARALLASDREVLLEYSLGDSSSSLWVVTRRAWRRITLPPRPALQARAAILRRGLADPASAEARATRNAARALYRALVEPAEPLLEGVTHLIVAPDGPLALVPFEALLARDVPESGALPRGVFLVERFDVSYTPSATALATRGAGPASDRALVALGDPSFAPDSSAGDVTGPGPDERTLPPLPNTAAEVEVLRTLAGGRTCVTLTRARATRTNLLALPELSRAQVVHLATHGEADEVEPDRSGLWLAREGVAPGFLSVGDIMKLRLGADLVTLSACETGLGRLERGEGVLGLARAFLAAGARSVVVSLWRVNDRSTARLMERFYRPLLARGKARERALAEAKRALLADPETRSPFYWAPFVLMGASGPLR